MTEIARELGTSTHWVSDRLREIPAGTRASRPVGEGLPRLARSLLRDPRPGSRAFFFRERIGGISTGRESADLHAASKHLAPLPMSSDAEHNPPDSRTQEGPK
jgi:hypothetical protein